MRLRRLGVTIAVVLSVTWAFAPSTGRAQEENEEEPQPIDASPKGKIGLGLLGAELGVAIPALIGVDDLWAYIVFPIAGAAGGAVAGHFLIDDGNHGELSVIVLAAGMTLIIPTLVLAAAATAYDPEDDLGTQAASLGTGALRLDEGAVKWAAPGISVVPDSQAGKVHVSGVHLSLVSGRF